MTPIITISNLNSVIADFRTEMTNLFNKNFFGPAPTEVGQLLAKYHKLVAPYINENQKFIENILQEWSMGELDDGRGRFLVEFLTGKENGVDLSYLWGIHIQDTEAEEFAKVLIEDPEYNLNLLPNSLQRYLPEDPEITKTV